MIWMGVKPICKLARKTTQPRVDPGDEYRDVRIGDRTRVEEGRHQPQLEGFAAVIEPFAGLPRMPDGADRLDHLPHFSDWRLGPGHPKPTLAMGFDLGPQAQDEPPARSIGQVPGCVG